MTQHVVLIPDWGPGLGGARLKALADRLGVVSQNIPVEGKEKMSAARRLLNLPSGTDDCALLGVSPGSSRAQIIHAAQGRLNAIAVHSQAESQDAQIARLEIRAAAQRLVAFAANASKKTINQSRPMHFGSIAAAVLMRRNQGEHTCFWRK